MDFPGCIIFFNKKTRYSNLSYEDMHKVGAPTHRDTRSISEISNAILEKNGNVIIDELAVKPNEATHTQIRRLLSAISVAKQSNPEIKIALWSNGLWTIRFVAPSLYKEILTYVKKYVDLFIVESYFPYTSKLAMWFLYKSQFNVFKKWGMTDKILFALGLNDVYTWDIPKIMEAVHNKKDYWGLMPWSNSSKILNKQIEYISKIQGIRGIGFFIKGGTSSETVLRADTLANYYFGDK